MKSNAHAHDVPHSVQFCLGVEEDGSIVHQPYYAVLPPEALEAPACACPGRLFVTGDTAADIIFILCRRLWVAEGAITEAAKIAGWDATEWRKAARVLQEAGERAAMDSAQVIKLDEFTLELKDKDEEKDW